MIDNLDSFEKTSWMWLPIFEVFSLVNSEQFFDTMGLRIKSSYELQDIAHNFVRNFGEQNNSKVEILENTFEQLEIKLPPGTNTAIFIWERHSYHHYSTEWYLALKWDGLLKFVFDKNIAEKKIPPPNLHPETQFALQSIVTKYRAKIYEIRNEFLKHQDSIEFEVQELWHDKITTVNPDYGNPIAWMRSQSTFVTRMLMWQKIQTTLSNEERDILELWGEEQGRKYDLMESDDTFPLVEPVGVQEI